MQRKTIELRALFNPVLDEAVPERLSAARTSASGNGSGWWPVLPSPWSAAATGWLLHGQQAGEIQYAQGDSMQRQAGAVRCRPGPSGRNRPRRL